MKFKQLKVRPYGDKIYVEDHNYKVDNWKAQLEFNKQVNEQLKQIAQMYNIQIDPPLDPLISQLQNIVNQMRYVMYGDFVLSSDHNQQVYAWLIQLLINYAINQLFAEIKAVKGIFMYVNPLLDVLASVLQTIKFPPPQLFFDPLNIASRSLSYTFPSPSVYTDPNESASKGLVYKFPSPSVYVEVT